MFSKIKGLKYICFLLAVAVLLPLFGVTAYAAEEEQKNVRVGYMLYEGFQNGGEGEAKSGSAYEYYQKIKGYAGWDYEYVYGSVSEMFKLLEKGEIDIMSCVTYSDERAEKFLFSKEPHGAETYFLYTHEDNDEITPAKLKSLNGKRVGVTKGSYQEQYFKEWCSEQEISCQIIPYTYMNELGEALTNHKVDAVIAACTYSHGSEEVPWKSIYRFTSESLYFAVSKTRPDILQELNDAQAYIISTDEYYSYETMKKYHSGINYHNAYLTPGQENYLEDTPLLKVGYLEGMNPLAFTDPDTGEMKGLCAEYLEAMTEAYGMEFETFVYHSENTLVEDLLAKKVDIVFPLGMGYWAAEELGIALSTSICSLPMSAIYRDMGDRDTFETVAVIPDSPTQEAYVAQFYPQAKLYYVENTKAALEAIRTGAADGYFIRSNGLDYLDKMYQISGKFRTANVPDTLEAFMGIRTEDATLSIILDKGISLLTDTQKNSAMFRYSYDMGKTSLRQAIKDNIEIVVGSGIILFLLCTVLLSILRLKSNQAHMKVLVAERDKAEHAERAKTEFLSHMSHDIRTPMNAIIGFTNFIKEENNLTTIKEDYVPKIETASDHLLMLINDVLEMSRIETGKLVFQRDIYDIQEVIESVITVMRMQAEKKHLTLTTDIAIEDRIVLCDQNHVSRVMMNLLSNAVKFTPEGGTVSVTIHQQPKAPAGQAVFEIKVTDTGIGMQPEFVEHVFEPFERERSSTISGMQGTGLGMAIVKNIISAAGGTISVESTPGQGTTFTMVQAFTLAAEEQLQLFTKKTEGKKHYSLEELKEYFKGRRILLVEDNEFNSTIAYAILENAGFLVETAENGREAVDKVIAAPVPDYYDVILMDIQMPVMNGYEASAAIRKLGDERAKVKIIAVTANAFESDRQKAEEAGMNGYVPKPLDVDVLYKKLLEITNISRIETGAESS